MPRQDADSAVIYRLGVLRPKVSVCLCVCLLFILHAGRDLVCQGVSVDQTSDNEDDQPRQKRRFLHTQSPEPAEQE